MGRWFSDDEDAIVAAAVERLIPGAAAAGADRYVDHLLAAFSFDPPHIWAGGPFSGRHGGAAAFDDWIPLGPMEEKAWRQRIEAWQVEYAELIRALGADFATAAADEQDRRLDAAAGLKRMLYEHACEGMYGDPVYGGNRDQAGWQVIGWVGDIQPRGYTDVEVTQRDKTAITPVADGG